MLIRKIFAIFGGLIIPFCLLSNDPGNYISLMTNSFSGNYSSVQVSPVRSENNPVKISVYPNPTSDKITISIENITGRCRIKIINLTGSKVYEENIDVADKVEKAVDLEKYPDGIYFLSVESASYHSITRIVKR